MADQPAPQVVVAQTGDTWSVKEVFGDLKADIVHRFDNVDSVLNALDKRLDSTATKADIGEVHKRIDGVVARIVPLEVALTAAQTRQEAVQEHRGRVWTRREKAWGLVVGVGTLAGIWFGPVVATALTHH